MGQLDQQLCAMYKNEGTQQVSQEHPSGPCVAAVDSTPLHSTPLHTQHPTSLPISAVLEHPPIYTDATRVVLAFRIFQLKFCMNF
jgi:hypothetical protein